MNEIELDDGLVVVKNYGKPTSVKVIDKRNPFLKKLRVELEHIFADVDKYGEELNQMIDELVEMAKELKEEVIKRKS